MANDERVKYRRLPEIDRLIRAKTYPNATSLGEQLGVSSRTIKRDIDELKLFMNAPIEYDFKRKGYYYSEEDYYLPAMHMTESDLISLVLTTRILEQYSDTPLYGKLDGILRKFAAYLPDGISINPLWLDRSFTYIEERHSRIDQDIWEKVFRAVQNKRVVRIWYKKPGEKQNISRKIKIYHIACHRSEWYLIAYSNVSREIRLYVVSRIKKAELLKENYAIPEDFDIKSYWGKNFGIYPHERDYEVELNFAAEIAHLVKEKAWNQDWDITDLADGGIRLKMTVGHLLEVKRWVLSWGRDVQVIKPPELREIIREEIECIDKSLFTDS